jgi:hypothetical protein
VYLHVTRADLKNTLYRNPMGIEKLVCWCSTETPDTDGVRALSMDCMSLGPSTNKPTSQSPLM